MRIAAALLLAVSLAPAARADGDPEGTERVELEVGKTFDVVAPDGSRLICDDPSVVGSELLGDGSPGFQLKALKPGTTLCGIRKPAEIPGGLVRITVKEAAKKKDEAKVPPPAADGGTDAGTGG